MNFTDRLMRRAFFELYIKASKEQATKDSRIVSSKMRDIEELKEWYFNKQPTTQTS